MKKMIVCMMAAALSFTFAPNQVSAAPMAASATAVANSDADAALAQALYVRLNEIKEMDKTNLTKKEKKELRNEVNTIKQQLSHIGGGVYISAGAVIVILILLIILL